MESFASFVYAALPFALGFLAFVFIAILVLHLKMRNIENQPKEGSEDGTGTDNSNRTITERNIDIIRRN